MENVVTRTDLLRSRNMSIGSEVGIDAQFTMPGVSVRPSSAAIKADRWSRVERLVSTRLLQGLCEADRRRLVESSEETILNRRDTFFRAGDDVQCVAMVLAGRFKLTQLTASGYELIVAVKGAGDLIDDLSAFPARRMHTCTARTMEKCHVLWWPVSVFAELLSGSPALSANALHILTESVQTMEERLCEVAIEAVPKRLARTLLRMLRHGQPASGGTRINFSREELAQMAGTTQFTVSRLLTNWQQDGVVLPVREAVVVVDYRALASLAEAV